MQITSSMAVAVRMHARRSSVSQWGWTLNRPAARTRCDSCGMGPWLASQCTDLKGAMHACMHA